MLQYSLLASGSSGNSILVRTDQQCVLIDAGLSGKQIEASMRIIGVDPNSLTGILVTHEHIDHVKGVGIMARRYKVPVFANKNTWTMMSKCIGDVSPHYCEQFLSGDRINIGDMQLQSFSISHDSIDPVGFAVTANGCKLAIVTDTGYVNKKTKQHLQESDAIIIEANHDVDMLRAGPYTWPLKQRILSDVGHLSNENAAYLIAEILSRKTKHINLAHLSRENNMPVLAHLTVKTILEAEQYRPGEEFTIEISEPDRPSKLFQLKSK